MTPPPKRIKDPPPPASPAMVDGYLRLALAVMLQAITDLGGDDIVLKWDAVLWLTTPDARTFLEAAGFEANPFDWLRAGCPIATPIDWQLLQQEKT